MPEKSVEPNLEHGISRHLKREGHLMAWLAIGVPIVLTVVLFLLAPYLLPLLSR